MIEIAIILAMATTAGILAYSAFQMREEHAQIKMLMSAVAMFFLIGTVFTGYIFALNGASTADIFNEVDSIENITGQGGRSTDAFGTQIAKNTNNLLNLPAHNPYSRERWRVKIDGEFRNLAYNTYPEYTKETDYHRLAPEQGGNVTLESAESPPYVVHYELWYSWATSVNRTLAPGDVIRIGAFNDRNGYFLKMDSTTGTDDAYIVVKRNGTITKEKLVDLEEPVTDFTRFELRSNWYNAGEQTWVQTTTDTSRENVQKNSLLGATAPEGIREDGPTLPQLPLRFQIQRGNDTAPISLNAGSANMLVAGDTNAVSRAKTDYFTQPIDQAGEWEPVAAIRIEEDVDYIRAELSSLDVAESSADTDFFATAQSHDSSLVLSESGDPITNPNTGWRPPEPLSAGNSIIQITTNISEAPNENGTTVLNTPNPGGFQIGWGSLYSSGNKGAAESSAQQDIKRPIYGSDVVVFWAKMEDENNPGVPADITIEYVTEEQW